MSVELRFSDASLDALADALAERLGERLGVAPSPWLSAAEAAEYMAAPISRVRQLTMTGELPVHRDGRRALYRREELDRYLLGQR